MLLPISSQPFVVSTDRDGESDRAPTCHSPYSTHFVPHATTNKGYQRMTATRCT